VTCCDFRLYLQCRQVDEFRLNYSFEQSFDEPFGLEYVPDNGRLHTRKTMFPDPLILRSVCTYACRNVRAAVNHRKEGSGRMGMYGWNQIGALTGISILLAPAALAQAPPASIPLRTGLTIVTAINWPDAGDARRHAARADRPA